MKEFIRIRETNSRRSTIVGLCLVVVLYGAAGLFISFRGFTYIYPPPEETSFLLDFIEEEPEPVKLRRGPQPRSENPDRTKPVQLAQRSRSPEQSERRNLTPATAPDTFGDVDTPTPEQETAIDPRAAFPGMARKDTSLTAMHSARESEPVFRAGQPDGNTERKTGDVEPNARLKGRSVNGNIPSPFYNSQDHGKIVVKIWVDNYGKVQKAVPGADGTTVTNKELWTAARNAAMSTVFSKSADAPSLQEGEITYIFKLK